MDRAKFGTPTHKKSSDSRHNFARKGKTPAGRSGKGHVREAKSKHARRA